MMPQPPIRSLRNEGWDDEDLAMLQAYNENHFDVTRISACHHFPLDDEPMVDCWSRWVEEAHELGAVDVLARYLPQLSFPVAEGISKDPSYRKATLSGVDPSELEGATGLEIEEPASVRLELYQSLAGRIPVLEIRSRQAFVALARALSKRNEPVSIPASMGAQMVGGFNNWQRIREFQQGWLETPTDQREYATWKDAFAALRQRPELFQDRFILLSDGPYSAVPASSLGLDDETWRQKSLIIRREHECTHYFTRRVFGSMRANLLDELICDYAGIVAAEGHFRADWFLRFVGLGEYPQYRRGGRLENYLGEPPLGDGAFRALQAQVYEAAHRLESFDSDESAGERPPRRRALILATLATQRLDELAAKDGADRLRRAMTELEGRLS